MKTSELTGIALDYAVAICEGMSNLRKNPHQFDGGLIMDCPSGVVMYLTQHSPSTEWAQGGLIIEREGIQIFVSDYDVDLPPPLIRGWGAKSLIAELACNDDSVYGETALIAAMRCYVASKLGDDVEIPGSLTIL